MSALSEFDSMNIKHMDFGIDRESKQKTTMCSPFNVHLFAAFNPLIFDQIDGPNFFPMVIQ